jgi:hypothetical protein
MQPILQLLMKTDDLLFGIQGAVCLIAMVLSIFQTLVFNVGTWRQLHLVFAAGATTGGLL